MATLEPKKYYNIILNENDKIEISKMIKEKFPPMETLSTLLF